jgi:hypothetical protein
MGPHDLATIAAAALAACDPRPFSTHAHAAAAALDDRAFRAWLDAWALVSTFARVNAPGGES